MNDGARGWSINADTERGWLYLRIGSPPDLLAQRTLADALTATATDRGNFRLIVEFAHDVLFSSMLVGELVVLHKRVCLQGGALRLCGVSEFNREVIRLMGLTDRLQCYPDRAAAGG